MCCPFGAWPFPYARPSGQQSWVEWKIGPSPGGTTQVLAHILHPCRSGPPKMLTLAAERRVHSPARHLGNQLLPVASPERPHLSQERIRPWADCSYRSEIWVVAEFARFSRYRNLWRRTGRPARPIAGIILTIPRPTGFRSNSKHRRVPPRLLFRDRPWTRASASAVPSRAQWRRCYSPFPRAFSP